MRAVTVNAAWPAANEMAAGATPVTRMAGGRRTHSTVVFVPTASTMTAPTTMPTTVPSTARTTLWPVLSALERSTESVPRTTQNPCSALCEVGDEHGARERGRAPEAVVQPGRVTVEVRRYALAGHGEQVGDTRRRSPEELIEPAASLGRHRALGVGGDLRDGVADLLGAEARVQRGRGRRGAAAHRVRLERGERVPERRDGVVQVVPRSLRSVQQPRAAVEHRRGGVLDRPGGGHAGAGVDRLRDAVQPLQLVDHPEDRPVRRSQAGGPERRREERAAQSLDGAVRRPSTPLPRRRSANPRHAPTIASRKGSAAGAGHRSVIARSEPAAAMPHPTRGSTGEDTLPRRHGQDEGEQERRRRPREHGADDRREQDGEPHDRHRRDRQPHGPRHQRSERRRAPRRRRRARPAPGAAGASSRRSRPAAASRTSRRRRRPPRSGRRRPPCRSRMPRAWRSPCARRGAAPRGRGRAAAAS